MAINFPDTPVLNDEFTAGDRTWIWTGDYWKSKTSSTSVSSLEDVALVNLANGEALIYNSSTEKWENAEVDVQGAIDTANAYTDQAVLDLTDYVDAYLDPSTGTTTDYIDQQDAATLAAAQTYADAADVITLSDANSYADQQDAVTLADAQTYADQQDATTLSDANSYTDAQISDLIGTAPGTLDTFQELAAAINNDPDFLTNLDVLPAQSGHAGEYLTTDGTTASWTTVNVSATTVSEAPPTSPTEGDAWFRSSTGQFFVYYDSFWIEIGGGSGSAGDDGIILTLMGAI